MNNISFTIKPAKYDQGGHKLRDHYFEPKNRVTAKALRRAQQFFDGDELPSWRAIPKHIQQMFLTHHPNYRQRTSIVQFLAGNGLLSGSATDKLLNYPWLTPLDASAMRQLNYILSNPRKYLKGKYYDIISKKLEYF